MLRRQSKANKSEAPSVVKGRKGRVSVLDCMVKSLWATESAKAAVWPAKTFRQLTEDVAALRGYPVPSSTVRSIIYRHSDLFERTEKNEAILYSLSEKARQEQ
jgi:hypothetical protein